MKLAAVDLNVLVALDAILTERNVTHAAKRIGRSQPATSHALNRARELFNDPLLVRVRGVFELTARARILAPKIHRLLRELGAVLDGKSELDPSAVEYITIGATDYVGFVLLPHLFAILEDVAPKLSVRVRTVDGPDALDPIATGAIDLAVGSFTSVPPNLRAETVFEDSLVCMRRRARKNKSQPPMTLDRFATLGHVSVGSPATGPSPVDQALARTGRTRRIAAYVPHFLVAPSLVASTDLVLTAGRRVADSLAATLGLEAFVPPVSLDPFEVQMVWHPRTEKDSVGIWLRTLVRDATTRMRASEESAAKRKSMPPKRAASPSRVRAAS